MTSPYILPPWALTGKSETLAWSGAEFAFAVPASEVRNGAPAVTYVALEWDGENFPTGDMGCKLAFTLKEVHPPRRAGLFHL